MRDLTCLLLKILTPYPKDGHSSLDDLLLRFCPYYFQTAITYLETQFLVFLRVAVLTGFTVHEFLKMKRFHLQKSPY